MLEYFQVHTRGETIDQNICQKSTHTKALSQELGSILAKEFRAKQ